MEKQRSPSKPDDTSEMASYVYHLARLSLSGQYGDVQAYVRRLARLIAGKYPEAASRLAGLVPPDCLPTSTRATTHAPAPIDIDSRAQLIRQEIPPILERAPAFSSVVGKAIELIVLEHKQSAKLRAVGLSPTRSAIMTGPPGLGKTMTARHLADSLDRPLFVLDLSSVMSSFLGRTGSNLRHVLDYARTRQCVMLLDEVDTLAKKRDDAQEVGELKRLVNVLLQEIDTWPSGGLLLAATNHPNLIDPAVWRRFEIRLDFDFPDGDQLADYTRHLLRGTDCDNGSWAAAVAAIYGRVSYSDIEREITTAKRASAIRDLPMSEVLEGILPARCNGMSNAQKRLVVAHFVGVGLSQHRLSELTGFSRDFIRTWRNPEKSTDG